MSFKKSVFIILFLIIALGFSATIVSPVSNLKAYDGSYKKTPLTRDVWQNFSQKILFEWKEPYSESEIKEYRYYFGMDEKGKPALSTTGTSYLTPALTKDGVYYFKVSAVATDGTMSEARLLTIKYDRTPIDNTLALAAYADQDQKQVLPESTSTSVVNKPIFIFDTAKLKPVDAGFKGINFYWGPNPKGTPDQQIRRNMYQPAKAALANVKYYLIANVEDEAGNISAAKQLYAYTYTGKEETSTEKPGMTIIDRKADIVNSNSTESDIFPGSSITYTIKLNNQGQGPAYNVEVKDNVPENTTVVLGSAKSTKPAVTEYWDSSLNGGNGAWITPESLSSAAQVQRIRWLFTDKFDPVTDKSAEQAVLAYTVTVNP